MVRRRRVVDGEGRGGKCGEEAAGAGRSVCDILERHGSQGRGLDMSVW